MSTFLNRSPLPQEQKRLLTSEELLLFWNNDRRADRDYKGIIKSSKVGIYYEQDINRLNSLMTLENNIINLHKEYQYNMLTINSRSKFKHSSRDYLDLILKINNNIRFTGFMDYLLGYSWVLEKGSSSRKWHIHIGLFWRSDCFCDVLLIYLKMYIERMSMLLPYSDGQHALLKEDPDKDSDERKKRSELEYRGFCSFDSVSVERKRKREVGKLGYLSDPVYIKNKDSIGIVDRIDYKGRNRVLKKLLYLSKVEYKKEKKSGEIDNKRKNNKNNYRSHRDNFRDVKKGIKLFGKCINVSFLKNKERCRMVPVESNIYIEKGIESASIVLYKYSDDYRVIDSRLLQVDDVDRVVGYRYGKEYRVGRVEDFFRY